MKILFFGDIIGRSGREGVSALLPKLREKHKPDFIIANAENAAHGKGLTERIAREFWDQGVDVLTMGNHTFDRKEIAAVISDPRLIRPANYPPGLSGNGSGLFKSRSGLPITVIQVMGRVYMQLLDDPFRAADVEIKKYAGQAKIIFVDVHAEITAEKAALAWHMDGRVSAVVGTHTHVQTADERLLPRGTAFLTDAGACGPHDSIIGAEVDGATKRFTTGIHEKLVVASGDAMVCGCVIDVDESTGRARSIERFRELIPLAAHLKED